MTEEKATVKIMALSETTCSLYCPYIYKKARVLKCTLFDKGLSYDENLVYRTGDCRDGSKRKA
jgi:hypothetical protein